MERKMPPNGQGNSEKEKQSRRNQAPWFNLYYKGIVIKTVWFWTQNQIYKSMEQDSPLEQSLGINLHSYGPLIYDTGDKNILWRKDSLFN